MNGPDPPIGGFFELEIGRGAGPFHTGAAALSSGRACLRHILETARPARVWVPFYICDAALQACSAAKVPVEFYAVDEAFEPVLPDRVENGDGVMYVNYFGLKTATAATVASAYPGRAIVDDTHAFFAAGYPGAWSFNSARKFFGVPDGGYAFGPGLSASAYPRPADVHYDHLVTRVLGCQDLAFEQFRANEAKVTATICRMSVLSERLLAGVDYPAVRAQRLANFAALDAAFGARNGVPWRLSPAGAEAPYCYPLLLSGAAPWTELWSRGVFAPRLWPELAQRPDARRFVRESGLADRLLPLPIDHRYGVRDMQRLVAAVNEVLGW